jgi:Transposase DDE domain group 1
MFRFSGVQFSERQTVSSERKHPAMSDSHAVFGFPLLPRKPVDVDFTGGRLSSDGGLVLLAHLDRRLRLTQRVAACLHDPRLPERVQHPLLDLVRQRVYQIAAGYEDCNDATPLRRDPALKVAVGRCPLSDADLASQPTLSRLEGYVTDAECQAINQVLLDLFLEQERRKPREVILDLDTSADPTHGQQEFAFFNGHYDTYCYLPLFAFATLPGEPQESLVSAELGTCEAKDVDAIVATTARLVAAVRRRWPGVNVIVRADGWFATPELYAWCEQNNVGYLLGLPGNAVLQRKSLPWLDQAKAKAAGSPTKSARCFGTFLYQAEGWPKARRVIVKAEVSPLGTNVRYVVVARVNGSARRLYGRYGQRGSCENRIKELKEGVSADRTSCHAFEGNQFRLMLSCVAYALLQGLRHLARRTGLERAQVERLRLQVIKIGARVSESLRRVKIELCSSCPSQELWRLLARRLLIVPR